MFDFKVYDKENKEMQLNDIDISGHDLDGKKIIDTAAIIEAEAVKGIILTLEDKKCKQSVFVVKSTTPLLIQSTK